MQATGLCDSAMQSAAIRLEQALLEVINSTLGSFVRPRAPTEAELIRSKRQYHG